MKFERFLLEDYLQTGEGKEILHFFMNLENIIQNDIEEFYRFVDEKLNISLAESYFGDEEYYRDFLSEVKNRERKSKGILDYCKEMKKFLTEYSSQNDLTYQEMQYEIPDLSLIFYIKSDYAFPYLYLQHFYKLRETAEIFELPLPPLPGKTQHLERCLFYVDLCKIFYDFRQEYNLSKEEFCVFLYGFAPRFLTNFLYDDLPKPNRVFLLGAAKEDVEESLLREIPPDDVILWQGNEEIEPGDIVILYETAPYSRLGSVWRAISPGFDDPFHYYSGKVFLTNPIKIPYISFKELQKNPVWGEMGLVKAHMQGINGKLCSVEAYEELKRIFKTKGFNTKRLPLPPAYASFFNEGLQNEKDVEKQLLEPFLERIGYSEKEWRRQLPLKMGRGFRYYPDYAIHVTGQDGDFKADFIWEAKYRIPTKKQEKSDYSQAKSYAIRLQGKGFGLVSMEGIVVFLEEDDFEFSKGKHYSWEELKKSAPFAEIQTLLKKIAKPVSRKKLTPQ